MSHAFSDHRTILERGAKSVRLFSDLLLHRMGPRLADDIVQGVAGPDEFRTAPLWGLGQRIFLLHDGRTTDLVEAVVDLGELASEKLDELFVLGRGHSP